jgi:hypothetical protein
LNHSGVAGATFANILGGIVTGGIAWGIDSASGADNKYESQVNMTLLPVASMPPAPSPENAPAPQPQVMVPPPPPVAPVSAPTVYGPGPWKARTVLIADRSAGSCSKFELGYSLDVAGDTFTAKARLVEMFSVPLPADGAVTHTFRPTGGATNLQIVGNARTRNLEIVDASAGCRWNLLPS